MTAQPTNVVGRTTLQCGAATALGVLTAWAITAVVGHPPRPVLAILTLIVLAVIGGLATALSGSHRRVAVLPGVPPHPPIAPPPPYPPPPPGGGTDQGKTNSGPPQQQGDSAARQVIGVPVSDSWWEKTAAVQPRAEDLQHPSRREPVLPLATAPALAITRIAQCPRCGEHRVDVAHDRGLLQLRCTRPNCRHEWTWTPERPWPRTSVRPPQRSRSNPLS